MILELKTLELQEKYLEENFFRAISNLPNDCTCAM